MQSVEITAPPWSLWKHVPYLRRKNSGSVSDYSEMSSELICTLPEIAVPYAYGKNAAATYPGLDCP